MIYFDFDGTLKEWNSNVSLEDVGVADYPIRQKWYPQMKDAFIKICGEYPNDVTVFTAVLNPKVERSKRLVIEEVAGKTVASKMVTTYYCGDKSKVIKKCNIRVAIKVYNGINGTKGTWKGHYIHAFDRPYETLKTILKETHSTYGNDVDILIDDFSENLRNWEASNLRR